MYGAKPNLLFQPTQICFFNQKYLDFFFLFLENVHVCCLLSLAAPHWGAFKVYPQHPFSRKN